MAKATGTVKKRSVAVDRKLVSELKTVLKGQKGVEVIGHLAVPAYCCGNGTVALVKIERGRPPTKSSK